MLPDILASAVDQWPDRTFLHGDSGTLSYAEFGAVVEQLARRLVGLGLQPGDVVCAIVRDKAATLAIWFAVNRAGALFVPLNTALRGESLRHQLSDSGAKIVIACPDKLSDLRNAIDDDSMIQVLVAEKMADLVATKAQVGDAAPPSRLPELEGLATDFGASTMILYTSGTTGPAKGCLISHAYASYVAQLTAEQLSITSSDVLYGALPLFHIFGSCGMALCAMSRGAGIVLIEHFSVSRFWRDIVYSGATVACVVGSMATLIANAPPCEHERQAFGQLRSVVGLPFTRQLSAIWKERFGAGWVGNMGYGLTEAGRVALVSVGDDDNLESCGRPGDFEIIILDDDDEECAVGKVGEIAIRPLRPGIMFDGYWGRPEHTLATMKGMWFHTGDMGRIDEKGYLHFVDRKKDCMRRGGENVSSHEVEVVFAAHPDVVEAAAFGVPSELSEEEIMVALILREDASGDTRSICEWAASRMPYFAVPRYIRIVNDLPRSPTGKVLKFELRDQGIVADTWDRLATDLVISR